MGGTRDGEAEAAARDRAGGLRGHRRRVAGPRGGGTPRPPRFVAHAVRHDPTDHPSRRRAVGPIRAVAVAGMAPVRARVAFLPAGMRIATLAPSQVMEHVVAPTLFVFVLFVAMLVAVGATWPWPRGAHTTAGRP